VSQKAKTKLVIPVPYLLCPMSGLVVLGLYLTDAARGARQNIPHLAIDPRDCAA
jgi:hypothetical protein